MRHVALHNPDVVGSRVALDDARAAAERLLGERFAAGIIDADELERRLDRVLEAVDAQAVEQAIADLLPADGAWLAVPDSTETTALARADEVRDVARFSAWFGEQSQRGRWVPGRVNEVTAVFGEATFDLREARLPAGVIEFRVNVVLGELELIVPPGIAVDVECGVFMGSVKHDEPAGDPTSRTRIRIHGRVVLGEVSISEREPGESKRQARKRRRHARKLARAERREARKALRPPRR